ncbi:phosphohistidine phosphatase SixA [Pseudidiomarina sp. YC-516-91]|uniref:phosphohistidine phosphatase SixA n=1 Tax=Pseudidiomarina salilacus TaxID=3384452 RepID=UPI003984DBA0
MSQTVKFYLMRHGDAQPAQALQADAIRPLSSYGEQEVVVSGQWLAADMAQQQTQVDWLMSSPFVRARQTAQIMQQQLGCEAADINDDITPAGNAELFADWLFSEVQRRGAHCRSVLMVSHMPFVSYLVAALDTAVEPMLFPTAGIAEIELDIAQWRGRFVRMIVAEPAQD